MCVCGGMCVAAQRWRTPQPQVRGTHALDPPIAVVLLHCLMLGQ